MCLSKAYGGLNLKNLLVWNQAAILKLLWDLGNKKDRLWVKSMHRYYIRTLISSISLFLLLFLGVLKKFLVWAILCDPLVVGSLSFMETTNFQSKKAYNLLLDNHPLVVWRRLVSNNTACPKAVFVFWMAMYKLLNIFERILKWNPSINPTCRICNSLEDSKSHYFGDCYYAKDLWFIVLHKLALSINFVGFEDQISVMIRICKKKTPKVRVIIRCWTGFIYEIWYQRNSKIFTNRSDNFSSYL